MESIRLVIDAGGETRFWEITWEELQVEVASGVLGSDGEAELRSFASRDEPREFVEEQVATRRAEGYLDAETPRPALTENLELEAMIEADPDALEPYLVYSDWLQARGHPRGQLITVQHALEAGAGEREALLGEERELLSRHAHALLGPLAEQPELAALRFRLGFVERAALFRIEPRSFDLDEEALLASFLAHPSCRFLRELVLFRPGGWEYDPLASILASAPRPFLRRLQIGLPFESGPRPLPAAALARCPRLEELAVFGGPLAFEPLAHERLRRVVVQGRLDAALLDVLQRSRLPELVELDLGHRDWSTASLDVDTLARLLAAHGGLRELALRCDDEERAQELAAVVARARLPLLRRLSLSLPPGEESSSALARLREAGLPAEAGEDDPYRGYLVDGLARSEDAEDYDEDGEDGAADWDDVAPESQIVDYDLGQEPELEDDEDPAEEDEGGVDRDWEREDPYDIDDEL